MTKELVVDFFFSLWLVVVRKEVSDSPEDEGATDERHGIHSFSTQPSFSWSTKELFKYTFICFRKLTVFVFKYLTYHRNRNG